MGPTFRASCISPLVDCATSSNPVISMGIPKILLSAIPTTLRVLKAMRLSEAPMSTNAFLIWTPFMVAVRSSGLQ